MKTKRNKTANQTQTDKSLSREILLMGMELSNAKWMICFSDGRRLRRKGIEAGKQEAVKEEIEQARKKFGLSEKTEVYSCYEAGREGFWVHRFLEKIGVSNRVLDPASIEVNRRARRKKTDRIDAEKLVQLLLRIELCGEKKVCAVVRVPTEEQEAAMRVHRARERLVKESTGHRSRIKSILLLHGIKVRRVEGIEFGALVDWEGKKLPESVMVELEEEQRRLEMVREQKEQLEQEQEQRIKAGQEKGAQRAQQLKFLRGVGLQSSWLLSYEFFWRDFHNRKEVGASAGLTGSPYDSGQSEREQGISKAGNRRVRTACIELAWSWLRFQPQSSLSQWYNKQYGWGTKRNRRVGIVALARKLLVALWKYLHRGIVPENAVVKFS